MSKVKRIAVGADEPHTYNQAGTSSASNPTTPASDLPQVCYFCGRGPAHPVHAVAEYVFTVGPSPNYRYTERRFATLQEARDAAYRERLFGGSTSRVTKVEKKEKSDG